MHCNIATYFIKNKEPCSPDTLINTSVFCGDLRPEFGENKTAGLSVASSKQWDMRPPELYSNWTKVLMEVGTIGLLGF